MSVILCVYNGAEYLAETIESVRGQSRPDWELIIVDDGSVDASAEVARRYADERIRLLQQANQGTAGALARGFSEARGEFIAFLDQDDLWTPDKLEAHLAWMNERPEIALTFSWFTYVNSAGAPIGLRSIRYAGTIGFRGLLEDFVIGATSNVVVRSDAIRRAGGIDRSFPRVYDLDLFLRIALLAPNNAAALPRDLMFYRRHSVQITRDFRALESEWERALEKMRGLASGEVAAAESRARCSARRYFARLAYERGSYRQALGYVLKALRSAPGAFLGDGRNWLTGAACLSGAILPGPVHSRLERWAGLRRG